MKKNVISIYLLTWLILYVSGAYIKQTDNKIEDENDDEEDDKDIDDKTTLSTNFQPVPLPTSFKSYDLNRNAFIELKELAEVSETSDDEASKPFAVADQDENNLIDEQEFKEAPWNLEGDVSQEDGDNTDDAPAYIDDDEDSDEDNRK